MEADDLSSRQIIEFIEHNYNLHVCQKSMNDS